MKNTSIRPHMTRTEVIKYMEEHGIINRRKKILYADAYYDEFMRLRDAGNWWMAQAIQSEERRIEDMQPCWRIVEGYKNDEK